MTWLMNSLPTPRLKRSASRFFFALCSTGWLLAGSAHAQAGLRVGGGWMTQSTAPGEPLLGAGNEETRSEFGYQAGVYYALPLTKRLCLAPEVQFSRERQQVETASGSPGSDTYRSAYHLTLSYLNLPVLARLALGPVYVEAGPQLSLLVGGRGEGTATVNTWGGGAYSRTINQAATDRYRRMDAGLCLGVGVKLPAGLGLNLRAYQGLVQFNRADALYNSLEIPYTAYREYRQTLQVALTCQLPARQ